jgi:hypothetical protein
MWVPCSSTNVYRQTTLLGPTALLIRARTHSRCRTPFRVLDRKIFVAIVPKLTAQRAQLPHGAMRRSRSHRWAAQGGSGRSPGSRPRFLSGYSMPATAATSCSAMGIWYQFALVAPSVPERRLPCMLCISRKRTRMGRLAVALKSAHARRCQLCSTGRVWGEFVWPPTIGRLADVHL